MSAAVTNNRLQGTSGQLLDVAQPTAAQQLRIKMSRGGTAADGQDELLRDYPKLANL
jgi:hypothetical protein